MQSVGPDGWLWLLGVIASGAAAVSLFLGAARAPGACRAGYRWLAAAALLWCVGAAGQQVLTGQLNGFAAPLTLADLFPLLALAPMAAGIVTLATAGSPASAANATEEGDTPATPDVAAAGPVSGPIGVVGMAATAAPAVAAGTGGAAASRASPGFTRPDLATQQFWGCLADSYVIASALFVIGWLTIFGPQYLRSGEDPRTFLLGLLPPLAGILVVSALLPLVAATGRRAVLPYLALVALTLGDVFGAGLSAGRGPRARRRRADRQDRGLPLAARGTVAGRLLGGTGRSRRRRNRAASHRRDCLRACRRRGRFADLPQ